MVNTASANKEVEALRKEFEAMKAYYEQRIQELEERVSKQEAKPEPEVERPVVTKAKPVSQNVGNAFNPNISVTLDAKYASYKNDPEDYELPGFMLGGEAGLADEGFALGHNEITLSGHVDDKFFAQLTLALHEHEGETETELEEAFIDTNAIGHGISIRAGRFFPSVGYINLQHEHQWAFADAPLVYTGIWGNKYIDDGLRLSWVAPTDLFFEIGVELLAGDSFPTANSSSSGVGSSVAFANIGGDFGAGSSWQLGMSYFDSDPEGREAGGHSHDGGDEEVVSFTGGSEVYGITALYKWAPRGNYRQRFLSLQGEYFYRDESGQLEIFEADGTLEDATRYSGTQEGFYLQGVYQFMPQWRAGLRYDHLNTDNRGDDDDVLEEAGLDDEGINPKRYSAMLSWHPSEFTSIRFQYNRDKSYEASDDQFVLQYTMSLGAHSAHAF
jgi:hypothetical protein